ncbi:MAG: GFA family protein [Rubrivivax sp.]|nr:MAG: GFA family protein [Rubrivivax sp.]
MPITGSCHCGQIAFSIEGEIPAQLTRCTCSFCAKRGALYAYYAPEQFKASTKAQDSDAIYRWQTQLVAHHFCAQCGCSTYSDSPAFELDGKWDGQTRRIGVNARLFDGFDAAEAPVSVIDGKNLW